MRAFDKAAPSSATNLQTLLGDPPISRTTVIGFQAPAANANTVFFGDETIQTAELEAGGSASLPQTALKDVFIKGTAPDRLTIFLFDR